jgi:putative transposase
MNSKSSAVTWKFTMFTYGRLQQSVISKAIEYGIPIVIVDPRNTSSTCPRCGEKLTYIHRLAMCKRFGFKTDRDSLGVMNIWLRALQACTGVPESPLSTPR